MSITERFMPLTTGIWAVDPRHSRIGFVVGHTGRATIRGEFTEFDGMLDVRAGLPGARGGGTVEIGSIFTDQPQRDAQLRSLGFFHAERYPIITFTSTVIEAVDATSFTVAGDLTILGVTHEIVLDAVIQGAEVDRYGNDRVRLEVTGELLRSDYGIVIDRPLGSGVGLISDQVGLVLDISAVSTPS